MSLKVKLTKSYFKSLIEENRRFVESIIVLTVSFHYYLVLKKNLTYLFNSLSLFRSEENYIKGERVDFGFNEFMRYILGFNEIYFLLIAVILIIGLVKFFRKRRVGFIIMSYLLYLPIMVFLILLFIRIVLQLDFFVPTFLSLSDSNFSFGALIIIFPICILLQKWDSEGYKTRKVRI